jgi:cell division septal protein FtsQ
MFQNKRKTDSRIRFQNSRFKHRLQEARGYKRSARNKPLGAGGIFLSMVGLGSWFSRFFTLLIFLLLIYLVFIPNVFFVKHVAINGAQTEDKSAIETLVNSYLSKKLPWPQKNLVLLSKPGLKEFLLKNDQKILAINSINKKLPATLIINITPRINQFVIQTASGTDFFVSNDGLVTNEAYLAASGTLPSNLTFIKLDDSEGLVIGNRVFEQNQIIFLLRMQDQLADVVKSPIDFFELASFKTTDLSVYFKTGPKVILSLNSNADQALGRLKLLFSQFSDIDIKKLYYVDMRFGNNGYVCYKGTTCVQNISLPTASTTPAN